MSQQNTNLTTNTSTADITLPDGGKVLVVVDGGTWGSGTLELMADDPASASKAIAAGLTADGQISVDLPKGEEYTIRTTLAGATAPNIDVWVITEE